MLQTAYWALAVGLALAGVGYSLYYQAQVWINPDKKAEIGKRAIRFGMAWIIMGFSIFVLGFIVWALCKFCPNLIGC